MPTSGLYAASVPQRHAAAGHRPARCVSCAAASEAAPPANGTRMTGANSEQHRGGGGVGVCGRALTLARQPRRGRDAPPGRPT